MYDAAQAMAQSRKGSRRTAAANRHPHTRETYALRSYVFCGLCGRRMFGQTERRRRRVLCVYFCCQPDRNHKGREDRFPDHPPIVRVRQDVLLDAVHTFIADRILGPGRRALLEADLPASDQHAQDDYNARHDALTERIRDITRRQNRILTQVEKTELDQDDTTCLRRPARDRRTLRGRLTGCRYPLMGAIPPGRAVTLIYQYQRAA